MEAFIVQHLHKFEDGEEDGKFIGVYSSIAEANKAVERSSRLPGFIDSPNGFSIDKYIIDEDNWREGYRSSKI